MKAKIFFFLFWFLGSVCLAQRYISGTVISTTGDPIAYVNIGIFREGVGTVSDINGKYTLKIPETYTQAKVSFSHIQYSPIDIPIQALSDVVTLHEVPLNLPEITIESQRMAQKEIGNRSKAGFLISGFSHGDLGGEVGSKFSIKKESVIEEVGFYIKSNSFDTVKLRLNVYSVKEKLPFQKLSSEEYITILRGQEGQMRLNLANAVLTNKDVIVTLELVSHSPVNSGGIYFSQSPPYLGKMYYRETSLDKVKKYIGGPMSMYLSIKYEK